MPYVLGIDLGSSRTTAAVCRSGGTGWDQPEAVVLDCGSRWVDSVLAIDDDATVTAGHHARSLSSATPERVASGFLGRVGDDVPLVLGDQQYSGEVLAAALAGWVTDRVADAERAEPDRIVLTHPPGWGAYRRSVLADALADAGLLSVLLVPSPVAVAHAHQAREPVDVGAVLAVCRIGGTSADGAVLRRGPDGFELLAHVEGPHGAAGSALDDLLVRWAAERLDPPVEPARLRAACVLAKERLSVSPDAVLPVGVEGLRLDRAEFARLARPVLESVFCRVHRLLRTGSPPVAVELAGGTARLPVVAELATEALHCPAGTDADPATAVCRGAALIAAPQQAQRPSTELVTAGARTRVPGDPPPRPPVELTPLVAPRRGTAAWKASLPGRRRDRLDDYRDDYREREDDDR